MSSTRSHSVTQIALPGFNRRTSENAHGGDHTRGKRKARRPFDPKQALHVVLRSSRARGQYSMLHPRHCNHIRTLTLRLQQRWEVSVYRYANVGNHLHLLIRTKSRSKWQGFIRELAGGIAMIVTGARKGNAVRSSRSQTISLGKCRPENTLPESAKRAFWDHLVYTRIVRFGRDFKNVARYVAINLWEGAGVPVRLLLARGFRVLDLGEDGGILIDSRAGPDALNALGMT